MANVRIKNIDAVTKSIKKVFKDSTQSKKVLGRIGNFAVDRIVANARAGKSLSDNKAPKKFPDLAESSKDIRTFIQEEFPSSVDSSFFRPRFANVTLTGQLLKALKFKFLRDSAIQLFFKDKRKALKVGDATSNNKVYTRLSFLGFSFLGLDKKGQKRVKKIVLDEFRRNIKKTF